MCNRGLPGCPGNVPLDASTQCRSHRILARWKAKVAAAKGDQGNQNHWIKAVHADGVLSSNIRQSDCRKECCRLYSNQVLELYDLNNNE